MKNIATPIIKNQANGSFAENEINKNMIALSYSELEYSTKILDNKVKTIEGIYKK